MSCRGVCLTLSNYTPQEHAYILTQAQTKSVRYAIVSPEVAPTTGTPHLQMYFYFKNEKSLDAIKKFLHCERVHIERQLGTHQQASDYCLYLDYPENKLRNPDACIYGDLPQQGKRQDWAAVVAALDVGTSAADIIRADPHLLPFQRAINDMANAFLEPIERSVRVVVLYGDAGTGKTRYAFAADPNLYSKPQGQWWNGYTGQATVLLDDFYGSIKYSDLLHDLDRYKHRVQVKGGFVAARWTTVFITSNKHPREWYSVGLTPALSRRITEIYYLEKDGCDTRLYQEQQDNLNLITVFNPQTQSAFKPLLLNVTNQLQTTQFTSQKTYALPTPQPSTDELGEPWVYSSEHDLS